MNKKPLLTEESIGQVFDAYQPRWYDEGNPYKTKAIVKDFVKDKEWYICMVGNPGGNEATRLVVFDKYGIEKGCNYSGFHLKPQRKKIYLLEWLQENSDREYVSFYKKSIEQISSKIFNEKKNCIAEIDNKTLQERAIKELEKPYFYEGEGLD